MLRLLDFPTELLRKIFDIAAFSDDGQSGFIEEKKTRGRNSPVMTHPRTRKPIIATARQVCRLWRDLLDREEESNLKPYYWTARVRLSCNSGIEGPGALIYRASQERQQLCLLREDVESSKEADLGVSLSLSLVGEQRNGFFCPEAFESLSGAVVRLSSHIKQITHLELRSSHPEGSNLMLELVTHPLQRLKFLGLHFDPPEYSTISAIRTFSTQDPYLSLEPKEEDARTRIPLHGLESLSVTTPNHISILREIELSHLTELNITCKWPSAVSMTGDGIFSPIEELSNLPISRTLAVLTMRFITDKFEAVAIPSTSPDLRYSFPRLRRLDAAEFIDPVGLRIGHQFPFPVELLRRLDAPQLEYIKIPLLMSIFYGDPDTIAAPNEEAEAFPSLQTISTRLPIHQEALDYLVPRGTALSIDSLELTVRFHDVFKEGVNPVTLPSIRPRRLAMDQFDVEWMSFSLINPQTRLDLTALVELRISRSSFPISRNLKQGVTWEKLPLPLLKSIVLQEVRYIDAVSLLNTIRVRKPIELDISGGEEGDFTIKAKTSFPFVDKLKITIQSLSDSNNCIASLCKALPNVHSLSIIIEDQTHIEFTVFTLLIKIIRTPNLGALKILRVSFALKEEYTELEYARSAIQSVLDFDQVRQVGGAPLVVRDVELVPRQPFNPFGREYGWYLNFTATSGNVVS